MAPPVVALSRLRAGGHISCAWTPPVGCGWPGVGGSGVLPKVGVVKALAVAVVVLGLLAPGATAVELVKLDGSPVGGAFQRWVDRTQVPTAPGRVTLRRERCGAVPACYRVDLRTVYLEPRDTRDLLHELGHDFDAQVMTWAARRRFGVIMRDPRPWASPGAGSVVTDPQERFADAFLMCATESRTYGGIYQPMASDYEPTIRQHRRVCSLIRRVATRARARPSS